ncbi:hypothetical protein F4810DRAFT_714942 [Camillea tinctor]|nr:hypothetical protein F4810DRAFT_714942 [Camillea tinctor]
MPPRKVTEPQANGDAGKRVVTDNDMKILISVFSHATASSKPVVVDWDHCASELNLKSGKTARDRFNQIINKYQLFTVNQESDPGKKMAAAKTTPTKKLPIGKRTQKVMKQDNDHQDEDSDYEEEQSPTKKHKPDSKANIISEEESDFKAEEDGIQWDI